MENIISPVDLLKIEVEEKEQWLSSLPKKGDHIRVNRGFYYHHGVYITDDEVIHFTGTENDNVMDWSKNEVIKTDIKFFLKDGLIEVKDYNDDEFLDLYPVEDIVNYARVCLGDKGYNLIFNNCEHFANTCTLGRFRSIQVERVFSTISRIPINGGKEMGFFGAIGGAIKSLFGGGKSSGSRSTSSTTYEPDRVRIAEIEADTKLKLAGKETERITAMVDARIEILEFETKCKLALKEAQMKGLTHISDEIIKLQEKLTDIAIRRLEIIEKGSLQVIVEIETFYSELGDKLKLEDDNYNTEKLPQLLELLERYEIGTPAHNIYSKRIEDDMMIQAKYFMKQVDAIDARQNIVLAGFISSKERVLEQTSHVTTKVLENLTNSHMITMDDRDTVDQIEIQKQLAIGNKE